MTVQLKYYNKKLYLDIFHNKRRSEEMLILNFTNQQDASQLLTINIYFFASAGGHSLHFSAMTLTLPAIMLKIPAIRMTTAAD